MAPVSICQLGKYDENSPIDSIIVQCPHDGPCPIALLTKSSSTAEICSFSQRLERPEFLRKTKHASRGHEFIEYSYVVIRRGSRPSPPSDTVLWDPIPISPRKERKMKRGGILQELGSSSTAILPPGSAATNGPVLSAEQAVDQPEQITLEFREHQETSADVRRRLRHWVSDAPPHAREDIRAESYYWPRILQSPLKRSGHVILETCTKEGEHILRPHVATNSSTSPMLVR